MQQLENDESSDALWILSSAFIIFTMQSGFGLLEAGRGIVDIYSVSKRGSMLVIYQFRKKRFVD